MFTIARNLRIDRLRREKPNQFTDLDDYDAPSDEPGQDEALHRLQKAVPWPRHWANPGMSNVNS